jgi:hypothetical protein
MKIKYEIKWKPFTSIKADPIKVCNEIEIIQEKENKITAESLVQYAEKKKNSELSKCFEWDDTEAAKEYRLAQARKILNHIIIEYKISESEECLQIRKYEIITIKNDDDKSEKNYVDIITAISKKDQRKQIFNNINQALDQVKEKLNNYNKLTELILE